MSNIMQNKKGISQVISVVIFLLLITASIGLLTPIIYSLIFTTDSTFAPLRSCLDISRNPPRLNSATINEQGQIEIDIKMGLEEVQALSFVIDKSSGDERFECGSYNNNVCDGSCIIPQQGASKTLYLNSESIASGNIITMWANGNCEVDSVKIR